MRLERENELVVDPNLFRVLRHTFPGHPAAWTSSSNADAIKMNYTVSATMCSSESASSGGSAVDDRARREYHHRERSDERLATGTPVLALEGIPNPRLARAVRRPNCWPAMMSGNLR